MGWKRAPNAIFTKGFVGIIFIIATIAITDSKQSPLATHASISIAVPIARPGRIYRMAPMTAVIDDILEACFDDPVVDADKRMSYFAARIDSIKGYWK